MIDYKSIQSVILKLIAVIILCLGVNTLACASSGLNSINVNTLEGSKVQIRLNMTQPVGTPLSFSTERPARVVLDFPGVKNLLSKEDSRLNMNVGVVRKASVIESGERTRLVVDLNDSVPYEVSQEGSDVLLTFAGKDALESKAVKTQFGSISTKTSGGYAVTNIDFRRGSKGEGRLLIELSDPNVQIDFVEEGTQIELRLIDTVLPAHLERQLDVSDFGTPIKMVNAVSSGNDVIIKITSSGLTESMAYQTDKLFTVEVRPLTRQEKVKLEKENFEYTGEKLSLNFQDIEVRAVLQLIADFTGLNIVSSDTVRGNVTLRLRNVPWDQALAIILKTKGLDKRQIGNVLLIGPSEELAAREKLELQTNQQVEELAPLRAAYIQVNYAKALNIATLLKDEKNSLLSSRGSATVDERTNTLLIQDTASKIDEIRSLVHKLDIPVRQVLIESRIVFANDDFEDALGIKFGAGVKIGHDPVAGIAGSSTGADQIANPAAGTRPSGNLAPLANRLGVNLPAAITGGSAMLGLTIAQLPGGTILDLELMALEEEGLGKIVASPRLITSNQQKAYIESGEEIPYLEASSSGAASIAFKKAVLRLEVTPQITPDDHVILDLTVNQDSRGALAGGVPAIDTREIHTTVLVANGDTVVLGGIYEQTKTNTVTRVPFLGRLPAVGWLFRNETNLDNRKELMIFVTPKIIKEGMA